MKRLSQIILILGFLAIELQASTTRLFWGVEESLCAATVSEQVSALSALEQYYKLLTEDFKMSPETRIEAFRRFNRLRDAAANVSAGPEFDADDLFETMLRVEAYRDRKEAVLRHSQIVFAELRDAFPDTYNNSKPHGDAVWNELLRLTDSAPNATHVMLFDEHDPYIVYEARDMRWTADQIAIGKLMVAPPEILLWVETLHGLMVLERSGVIEESGDVRNLETPLDPLFTRYL
ncbi:MAG: hypothetical protein R3B54_00375 [Bdellovibrionota bacterium]